MCCTNCHTDDVKVSPDVCRSLHAGLSWTKLKHFNLLFCPSLLVFCSLPARLFPMQPLPSFQASLSASVSLPSFSCVVPMCVMYICMTLQSSFWSFSFIPVSSDMPPNSFCLAYSACLTHHLLPVLEVSHMLQATWKDIQILLNLKLDLSVTGISHKYKHSVIKMYCVLLRN